MNTKTNPDDELARRRQKYIGKLVVKGRDVRTGESLTDAEVRSEEAHAAIARGERRRALLNRPLPPASVVPSVPPTPAPPPAPPPSLGDETMRLALHRKLPLGEAQELATKLLAARGVEKYFGRELREAVAKMRQRVSAHEATATTRGRSYRHVDDFFAARDAGRERGAARFAAPRPAEEQAALNALAVQLEEAICTKNGAAQQRIERAVLSILTNPPPALPEPPSAA